MLDIFPDIQNFVNGQKPFALATVINTWRSAPRVVGSCMAVTKDMDIAGSVSGGCVEGEVVREAMEVLETGESKRLVYGVTDEDAWTVGLSCGGRIEILLERFMSFNDDADKQLWPTLQGAIAENRPCVLLTDLTNSQPYHDIVFQDGSNSGNGSKEVSSLALEAYRQHKNQILTHEGHEYFANVFPAKDKLVLIGAAHVTVDLVDLAHQFNFETVVIDPRGIFINKIKFKTSPDEMIAEWPEEVLPDFPLNEDTYAVVLSHDPKIDDQALSVLLRSKVAYIGALGSRKTHAKRIKRLTEAGFSEKEIEKIHGPVGVNINALKPQEIALSIMAELIKEKNKFL